MDQDKRIPRKNLVAILVLAVGIGALVVSGPVFAGGAVEEDPDTAEIRITAENYEYRMGASINPEIVVPVGATVRVELEVTEGTHDWVVDEFDAATEQVDAGETTTVEFVADEVGEFEYYCSRGTHREEGMYGAFVVRD